MPSSCRSCQEQHKAPGFWNFYKLTYVLSVVSLKGLLQNYTGLRLGFHLFFYQKKAVKKKDFHKLFLWKKKWLHFVCLLYRPPCPSDLSCSSFSLSPHQIWLFCLLVLFYFILILILFCLKININLKNRFFKKKNNGNRKILDGTIGMKSELFLKITPNSPLLFFPLSWQPIWKLMFWNFIGPNWKFSKYMAKKKKNSPKTYVLKM